MKVKVVISWRFSKLETCKKAEELSSPEPGRKRKKGENRDQWPKAEGKSANGMAPLQDEKQYCILIVVGSASSFRAPLCKHQLSRHPLARFASDTALLYSGCHAIGRMWFIKQRGGAQLIRGIGAAMDQCHAIGHACFKAKS